MTLSDKTQHQLDAEYRNNTEAVQANAAWINAHEAYAAEFGGRSLCSVCFGKVTTWVSVDNVLGMKLSMPVRFIASYPVYEVEYHGFVLNATGECHEED